MYFFSSPFRKKSIISKDNKPKSNRFSLPDNITLTNVCLIRDYHIAWSWLLQTMSYWELEHVNCFYVSLSQVCPPLWRIWFLIFKFFNTSQRGFAFVYIFLMLKIPDSDWDDAWQSGNQFRTVVIVGQISSSRPTERNPLSPSNSNTIGERLRDFFVVWLTTWQGLLSKQTEKTDQQKWNTHHQHCTISGHFSLDDFKVNL